MVTFRNNNSNTITEDLRLEVITIEDPHLEVTMEDQSFLIMIIFKEKYQVEIIIMLQN